MRHKYYWISIVFLLSITSGYSYDDASSCSRMNKERRSMRSLAPCDLSKHTYCTTPGSAYPWHAVQSFIHENQGLMKRMYGEQRHSSIFKQEFRNDLDSEELDVDFLKNEDFDLMNAKLKYSDGEGRAFDKPHFRPINRNPSPLKHNGNNTNITTTTENEVQNKTENTTKSQPVENDKTNYETTQASDISLQKTSILYKGGINLESIANVEVNNVEPTGITLKASISETLETNNINDDETPIHRPSVTANTTDVVVSSSTTNNVTKTSTSEIKQDQVNITQKNSEKPIVVDSSTFSPTFLFSVHDRKENVSNNNNTRQEEDTVIKFQVINACATKEEAISPFWANNTRGDLRALLNTYPYDQVIHIETCRHEHKKMYCRDGCRCEQKYSLYRLLAYDPENGCKGIFTDWFKFPSCCICKCYIPYKYRRSPRQSQNNEVNNDEAVNISSYDDL